MIYTDGLGCHVCPLSARVIFHDKRRRIDQCNASQCNVALSFQRVARSDDGG